MFYHIVKAEESKDDEDDEDKAKDAKVPDISDAKPTTLQKKGGVLKNKIKFVSKLLKMQKLLRFF